MQILLLGQVGKSRAAFKALRHQQVPHKGYEHRIAVVAVEQKKSHVRTVARVRQLKAGGENTFVESANQQHTKRKCLNEKQEKTTLIGYWRTELHLETTFCTVAYCFNSFTNVSFSNLLYLSLRLASSSFLSLSLSHRSIKNLEYA